MEIPYVESGSNLFCQIKKYMFKLDDTKIHKPTQKGAFFIFCMDFAIW